MSFMAWKARLHKCPLRYPKTAVWVHLSQFIAWDPPGEQLDTKYEPRVEPSLFINMFSGREQISQAIRCSHNLSGTLFRQGTSAFLLTLISTCEGIHSKCTSQDEETCFN
ncbi:hypothetical protein TNCV_4442091 [Trichonephila clavipes]|nr:hypothetical protein TNCV_4442091 [Trichonephila clavipes]